MAVVEDLELEMLISIIYEYYGYDFSGYARASLLRRVTRVYQNSELSSFHEFLTKIRSDTEYCKFVIDEITVNVTEMFRDASFYKLVREVILPALATKPFIRIWHAGCSTGEEVYSMAIILAENGVLHKALLYATDINEQVLESAKKGIFPLRLMKEYSENYRAAGGTDDFSKYYIANYGVVKFNRDLSSRMVFSQHNLVSDNSFNEFDLILCRNVLIYFDTELQERVIQLFNDSLAPLGYLALGTKETIRFSAHNDQYKQIEQEKVWRKMY